MPPAATMGMVHRRWATGIMAIVLTSPMCPPASMPEHTTASAPKSSIFLATLAEGTTGITLMPAAFQAAIKFLGEPAPVDTTGTFSSMMTCEISSTFFMSSMTLTPKGLSVSSRQRRLPRVFPHPSWNRSR